MPRSKKVSEAMRAESRKALLKAARKLFAEQGYFNCTVSAVAAEAGMSQGNLYWYFPSKEALLQAVLAGGFESLATLAQEAAAGPGQAADKVAGLVEATIAFGREQGQFMTIFLSLMAHGGPAFLASLGFDLRQIGFGYHQSLNALFAQAQAEGLATKAVDPNTLTMFFFGLFNGLTITYSEEWLAIPEEQLQAAVLRLLGGLGENNHG